MHFVEFKNSLMSFRCNSKGLEKVLVRAEVCFLRGFRDVRRDFRFWLCLGVYSELQCGFK